MRGEDKVMGAKGAKSAKIALSANVEDENDNEEHKVKDNYCYCYLQSGFDRDTRISSVYLLI